jgi:multidrug resistance protein MdtO
MASLAQDLRQPRPPLSWFWEFLKQELAPYQGRTETVMRMVIAATLVMVICMTFRVPYAFLGAVYTLVISRETPRATLRSAGTTCLVTVLATAYVLIAALFVIDVRWLHFLWNISSFFLAFYAASVLANYSAATAYMFVIASTVPLWDRLIPAENNVEDTLWILLSASIGFMVTVAVELAFAHRRPGDDIVLPLADRLASVQSVLVCYAEGRPVGHAAEERLIRMGMLGTSRLRRLLRRSDYSTRYRTQMGSVVALAGSLVDTAASLTQLRFEPSGENRKAFRTLAATVASIRSDLLNRQIPGSIQLPANLESAGSVPLLREMENTVALIPQAFAGSRSAEECLPSSGDMPHSFIAPDAFVNLEHFKFSLKGGLAASLCYITYNSIAWPGISTAVTTCMLTALTTIGASHQKQTLRLSGAVVGGFLTGIADFHSALHRFD